MLVYRKTRDGNWAVFGPLSELKEGRVVVHKKAGGTKEETVTKVSKSFDVDGVPHAYGFLGPPGSARSGGASREKCAECGRGGELVADLEDGMMKHYKCCDIPP